MTTEISLNCCILGLDNLKSFPVDILPSQTVAHLKDAIKKKNEPVHNHIARSTQNLEVRFQLKDPLEEDKLVEALGEIVDGETIPGADELQGANKLFRYFSDPPAEEMIHLVVQAPPSVIQASPPGALPASGSEPSVAEFNAYQNIRTYLWGKNRFNVRQADGKEFTMIDLTHIGLPRLNPLKVKILLVRKEYELAYESITECAKVTRAVCLITGQPGIGKRMFLLYLLVRLLGERKTVALQFSARHYVLFNEQGINIRKGDSTVPSGSLADAWVLSDSMGMEEIQPCSAFRFSEACLVHTSSPAARDWKDWTKQLAATRHIMDLWTEEEFQCLLSVSGSNIHCGLELFTKYGSNITAITVMLLKPVNEEQYIADICEGAEIFADRPSEIVLDLQGLGTPRTSHLTIPTTFLQETLGEALSRKAAAKRHDAFTLLSSHPSLRGAAGWVFEHTAHINPNRPPLPTYIGGEAGPTIPPAKNMIAGSIALGRIQMSFDFYWRPQETDFRGVDALIGRQNDV